MRSIIRKPSIKKSISSRTTGRATRTVHKVFDPTYGNKGAGYIKNPKKALYNKVYNATSYGVEDFSRVNKSGYSGKSNHSSHSNYQATPASNTYYITNNNISEFVREYPQVVNTLRSYYVKRLLWGIYFFVIALLFMILVPSPTLFAIGLILLVISVFLFYKAYQYHYAYKDAQKQLYKIGF